MTTQIQVLEVLADLAEEQGGLSPEVRRWIADRLPSMRILDRWSQDTLGYRYWRSSVEMFSADLVVLEKSEQDGLWHWVVYRQGTTVAFDRRPVEHQGAREARWEAMTAVDRWLEESGWILLGGVFGSGYGDPGPGGRIR